jgi:two-component system, OmpR family, sensor kinase
VIWSLRARLTAWYSAVVVVVLIAGASVVVVVQERLSHERLDEELARLMLTLQGVMRTEFGEGLDLQASADEASIEVVAPDRLLVLTEPDGTLLAMWGQPMDQAWRPAAALAQEFSTIAIAGRPARAFTQRVEDQRHRYVAAVVAPLQDIHADHAGLRWALAAGVLAALVVAALGGWVVGRQTLKPLEAMAAQATSISEEEPVGRLHTPNEHDELGRLAHAFNGLLDRLARVLHAQRQFMADASHELRTPVSVVHTTAQVALSRDTRSAEDYRESLTIVAEQSTHLSRLVNAMFLLSRAEARGLPLVPEAVYLDDIVADATRALNVLAREREITVEARGDTEVAFVGDETLLRQLIRNLLDNAVRHAKSGGLVSANVHQAASAVTIRVTDDGEGVPDAQRERIFDRFVRIGSTYSGAGLGLPIARWIAEAHGGTLVLESSGPTGSVFTVTLPK